MGAQFYDYGTNVGVKVPVSKVLSDIDKNIGNKRLCGSCTASSGFSTSSKWPAKYTGESN